MKTYEEILTEQRDAVIILTINREANGNKLTAKTCLELVEALQSFRLDPSIRAAVLTGAGQKFFCIGGEHDELTGTDQSQVLPIIDVYQAIDTFPKPVIAAVNGFAVGGGQVLQTVCDLSIASEAAAFRQVGPMVGSFDAGYGTWYLEETIGRKWAKEMWYLNRKYDAHQALAMGLINEVVPPEQVVERAVSVASEVTKRSPFAIGALKAAFSARHNGVSGQARMAHDQLLTLYLHMRESHEMAKAFAERRDPEASEYWK